MYEHENFTGRIKEFCSGVSKFSEVFWNNQVTSLKLGKDTSMTVFDGENFQGNSKVYDADARNLKEDGWSDKISSFKIGEYYNFYFY